MSDENKISDEDEAPVVADAAVEEPSAEVVEEAVVEEAVVEEPSAEVVEEAAVEQAAPVVAAPEVPKVKKKRTPRAPRPRRVRITAVERAELRKQAAAARRRRRGEVQGGEYVRTPTPDDSEGRRRERRGVVTSDKSEQTITVRVDVLKAHPKYKKIMRRSMSLHAHDEQNTAKIGDTVRVVETRPLSRTKRWRLVEIIEVAQ